MTGSPEFYDASSPATLQPSSTEVLTELGGRSAEQDLDAALDVLTELVAAAGERDRREPLPDDLVAVLRDLTGAEDAPLAWASLRRRVRDGVTTWESFWADPTAEADGVRLVREVLRRSGDALDQALPAHTPKT